MSHFDLGSPDVDLIMALHRYKRPKGSRTEQAFIEAFLSPLGVKADAWGNLHLDIGENPTVLWSGHTDTVHTSDGYQRLTIENNVLRLAKKDKSNCLGADDGAGVWLMMEMIKAKVPGKYIFHYGEEKGCEGSENLAKHNPEVLKGIKAAIALDRRGFSDVITFMTTRTCSDAFADSLAKQLPPGYRSDQGGSRTDVKLYDKLVPECTNISVGYNCPHTCNETLNLPHIISLRDKLVKIDFSKLTISRDPSVVENKPVAAGYTRQGGYSHAYQPVGEYTPKTIHEIFDRNSAYIADLMIRAGVTLDSLMHVIVEEQKKNPRANYTYRDPKLVPPTGWKSPFVKETTPAASTTSPPTTPASAPPASNASVTLIKDGKVVEQPATSLKDVTPRHIGAADQAAGSNVHPLRTGNPALDGTKNLMTTHGAGLKH